MSSKGCRSSNSYIARSFFNVYEELLILVITRNHLHTPDYGSPYSFCFLIQQTTMKSQERYNQEKKNKLKS